MKTLSDARREFDELLPTFGARVRAEAYPAQDRTYAVLVITIDGTEHRLDFSWDPDCDFDEDAVLDAFVALGVSKRLQ